MNYEVLATKGKSSLVLITDCSIEQAINKVEEASKHIMLNDRSFTIRPIIEGETPVRKHMIFF